VTVDDRKRAQAVIDAASQRDPEERDAFINSECAGNASLRALVNSLLTAHAPSPYTPPEEPADAMLEGHVVGPYIIRRKLGRGGMGVVYLADDTRLSRRVALKAIDPILSRDAVQRERLRQEARAGAGLSHQGIAVVYALEEIGDQLYLASEFVEGPTLRALLEQGPLPSTQVVDIATQLARAIAAAHINGVVHRDLKPENVIRSRSGVVKVLDFGLARVKASPQTHLTQTGTIVGTPAYMAPEQAQGHDVDFRSDLFSFGVLIYEIASGSNPFDAGTILDTLMRILEFEPVPLSQKSSSSGSELDRIIATCLSKHPPDRYKDTQDLVTDLESLKALIPADRDRPSQRPAGSQNATSEARRLTARWWWEFHQAAISALYVLMMYPAWRARSWLPPRAGILFLFVVLACAAAATAVRLHLWFTARFYPEELTTQLARARPWTRSCDVGFAAPLLPAAVAIGGEHLEFATLMVTMSILILVSSFMIEPTTTRAAFRGRRSGAIRTSSKRQ